MKGNYKQRETVEEMIQRRSLPVPDSSRCLEPVRKSVRPKRPECDSEEDNEGGETKSSGRGHNKLYLTWETFQLQEIILAHVLSLSLIHISEPTRPY